MLALCSTSLLTKHAYLHFAAHTAMVEGKKDFAKIYIYTVLRSLVLGYNWRVSLQFMGNCMMACAWWTLVWIVIMIMLLFFHSITTCWPLCLFILNNFKVDMNYKQLMLLVGVYCTCIHWCVDDLGLLTHSFLCWSYWCVYLFIDVLSTGLHTGHRLSDWSVGARL